MVVSCRPPMSLNSARLGAKLLLRGHDALRGVAVAFPYRSCLPPAAQKPFSHLFFAPPPHLAWRRSGSHSYLVFSNLANATGTHVPPNRRRMRFSIAGPALLLLTAAGETAMAVSPTAADYFVRSLPGKPKDSLIKMHAG